MVPVELIILLIQDPKKLLLPRRDIATLLAVLCGATLLVLGPFLAGWALLQAHGQTGATEEPEDISLRALIAREPGGNPHVRVREFTSGRVITCASNRFLYRGEEVFVPVFPADEQVPPQAVPVVVRSVRMLDRELLQEFQTKKRVAGMVWRPLLPRRGVELPLDAMEELQAEYPGTDFSTCVILEEGDSPSSVAVLSAASVLATASWLMAVYLIVRVVRPKRSSAVY